MENILLLTDFSDLSAYARSVADKIALKSNANLHVLKVVETTSDVLVGADNQITSSEAADISKYQEEMDANLQEMEKWCASIQSKCKKVVLFGSIHNKTIRYSEAEKMDLIVMGTHGLKGFSEMVSSSVSEHLIKSTHIPVLTLKCDREQIDFSDIVITGNFKSEYYPQLNTLKILQKLFNSKINLLWVNTEKDFKTTNEIMIQMEDFVSYNDLNNVEYFIQNDISVEDGILNFSTYYEHVNKTEIDLLAVEKKKSGWGLAFSKCEATGLVNHIYKPIFTYNNFS